MQDGDPLDRVYTVTRGMLRRVRYLADGRRQITRFIAPGDFLGLEPDRVYHGDVEAVTPTDLCSMSRRSLEELSARFPRSESGFWLSPVPISTGRGRRS